MDTESMAAEADIIARDALILPRAIHAEIIAHARQGKPEEICGILRGRGNRACELIRARNVAPERIENYDVDPQTLLLQFKFEEAGDQMMAIYHSHPVSVAYPSATDAWNAHYPDTFYLICSLEYDHAPVIRAFRMLTHYLDLEPEQLATSLPFSETRPGLFAYYQPAQAAVPAPLATVIAQVAAPFYVDYARDGDDLDLRVVAIREHPLQIV